MPFVIGGAILGGAAIAGGSSMLAADKQAGAANNATNTQLGMFNQTQQNLAPWMSTGQVALGQLAQLTGTQPGTFQNPAANQEVQRLMATGIGQAEATQRVAAGWGATPSQGGDPMTAPLTKPFGLSDFQQSPAYQFNLEQGQNAINKASAARGNYYAPQTIQDISKFSQGLASNEFQNAFSNYNQSQANIWNRLFGLSGSGQNAAAGIGTAGGYAAQGIAGTQQNAGASQAAGIMGIGNAASGGLQNAYNAYLTNQILSQQQQSAIPGQYGYSGTTGLSTNY